jgi:hypothetical protein
MSYYEHARPAMGEEMATVDPRLPGGQDVAETMYRPVPSAGPRVLPPHVQAARRRQIQIDAMTGEERTFDPGEQELQYAARRMQASATAVNRAIHDSPSHSGSLGAGTVLAQPADHLPWLMFGAGD